MLTLDLLLNNLCRNFCTFVSIVEGQIRIRMSIGKNIVINNGVKDEKIKLFIVPVHVCKN
jgi:hypothetical protein